MRFGVVRDRVDINSVLKLLQRNLVKIVNNQLKIIDYDNDSHIYYWPVKKLIQELLSRGNAFFVLFIDQK